MDFKEELHNLCHQLVDERIMLAQKMINEAQQAANMESKSSAGDKYETGKAMMMLEREKAESQLLEASKLKIALNLINPSKVCELGELGSLIRTNKEIYYLAVSLGKVTIKEQEVFVLSPVSPMGKLLLGSKVGGLFIFNSQSVTIEEIK